MINLDMEIKYEASLCEEKEKQVIEAFARR